ncbi:MAG TPA: PilZ domain-containing protein [Terriglobales bacterium]|nr:PilZ domain-containing protein [Terriglobales bacterium]
MESRKHRRYRLSAPVKLSWKASNGDGGQGEGMTRDISVSSAYIATASQLPSGTIVQMTATLPALDGSARGPQLSIEARVVRSERFGFAVTGDMGFHLESQDAKQGDTRTFPGEDKSLLMIPRLRTSTS